MRYVRFGARLVELVPTDDCEIMLEILLGTRGVALLYKRGGRVEGFRQLLLVVHHNVRSLITSVWASMHDNKTLDEPYSKDSQTLGDIFCFVAGFAHARRELDTRRGKLNRTRSGMLYIKFKDSLIKWIAASVDKYMVACYAKENVFARLPALRQAGAAAGSMGLGAQLVPLLVDDRELAPVRRNIIWYLWNKFGTVFRTRCEAA